MKRSLLTLAVALFATTTYAHDPGLAERIDAVPRMCIGNEFQSVCIVRASIMGTNEHPKRRRALVTYASRRLEGVVRAIYLHICGEHEAYIKLWQAEAFERVDLADSDNLFDHEVARILCLLEPAQPVE